MTSSKKSTLQNFQKRIKRFSFFFPQYKKIVKITHFIDGLLTPEQRKILEFEYEKEVWDFKTQMLLYFEYRYHDGTYPFGQTKDKAEAAFKKYEFLFECDLAPDQIRTILLRELMEVISIGSQCFKYKRFFASAIYRLYRMGKGDEFTEYMRELMVSTYKNLPIRIERILSHKHRISFNKEIFGPGFCIKFDDVETKMLWIKEFFKKTKGYFEYLNFAKESDCRKHKERLYQEINFCIGLDKNYSCSPFFNEMSKSKSQHKQTYNYWVCIIKYVPTNTNLYLQNVIDEVMQHFNEEELEKLERVNAEEKKGTFKEQLLDRFYSKYPSLVSLENIEKRTREKLIQYKSLFANAKECETAKEVLLDELEKDLFVSYPTHVGNKEMMENLQTSKNEKIKGSVMNAINQIISLIKCENLEIEGVQYDLQTLLMARGKRSGLAMGKNTFNRKLLYTFMRWGLKKEMTPIDLQIFLEEMDSCFLYPDFRRKRKFFTRRDGTGELGKIRKNLIDRSDEFINICSIILFVTVVTVGAIAKMERNRRRFR